MPTVIFINSVVSVLYHFGLMQMLVEKFAVLLHVTMGTTAAETMCTVASMFLGQVNCYNKGLLLFLESKESGSPTGYGA